MPYHQSFQIGSLTLANRLIQGPLAGYSCAPFRESFLAYQAPAYCVTEMISAHDVLHKHQKHSRYLYKSPLEGVLCYQLSGNHPEELGLAAQKVQDFGADLIDINCGCPKPKIRKKGAGSALLETPLHLFEIVKTVKRHIHIPLTVKIRIQDPCRDAELSKAIEEAGADALIVHGRTYLDDYDKACNFEAIANIKAKLKIPVIANGDISDKKTLHVAHQITHCDAYMISRAACGKPWLYQTLLNDNIKYNINNHFESFKKHILGLAQLEDEFKALLQSRSLVKYYFRDWFQIEEFYNCETLEDLFKKLEHKIRKLCAPLGH